ncbi:hypothetical protein C8R45DRAFT_1095267 [Mycena sanguinolenta]|nr:hypothetical protein C8R45DRAFT_1095267 [Mycena sanguinolenta]
MEGSPDPDPVPRGRGRPRGSKNRTTGTRNVPKAVTGSKRGASPNSDYEEPKKKSKQAPVNPLATDPPPRPRRANRNKNPGFPDQPRAKRTTAQVQADEDAKLKIHEARVLKRAEGVTKIAAIDTEQDQDALEDEENSVLTLDDMADTTGDTIDGERMDVDEDFVVDGEDEDEDEDTVMEFDEEDFDRADDDEAYRSQNEFEPSKIKLPAAPRKRTKKVAKGETRHEIEAAVTTLKAKGKASGDVVAGKKKAVQNGNAAAASRKAGISQRWTTAKGSTKAPDITPPPSPPLGGLDDDDAGGARPKVSGKGPRKNETVTIDLVTSSDAEDDTPTRVPAQPARKSKALVPKSRQSIKVESTPKLPALVQKPAIKAESSGTFQYTPPTHADVKGLPAFIGTTWPAFLAVLHHALNLSLDPMQFGTRANAVAEVQVLMDANYHQSGYKIAWGDAICSKAVSRVGERRGAFGLNAIKAVDEMFKHAKYYYPLDAPEATRGRLRIDLVHEDAQYALRSNGPALFKQPAPATCLVTNPKKPGYIKPRGFLESRPFIETVRPFLKNGNFRIIKDADGNLDLSALPVGAMVMGAIAVERAYKLHSTGRRAENAIPDFSATKYATAAAGYLKSILSMTEGRWTSILEACGATASVAEAASDSLDVLDGERENMYVPSSP